MAEGVAPTGSTDEICRLYVARRSGNQLVGVYERNLAQRVLGRADKLLIHAS